MSVKIYIDNNSQPFQCVNCGNDKFTNIDNWDETDSNLGVIHFTATCYGWSNDVVCGEDNYFHATEKVELKSNQ